MEDQTAGIGIVIEVKYRADGKLEEGCQEALAQIEALGYEDRLEEDGIGTLCDCGLVHKVSRVNAAGIPLKAYEDLKAFKLFIVDVGLLGCMTGLRQITLLDGNDLFTEFKGALTEQYVCQQLKTIDDLGVYYYTNDRGSCEVDFIIDTGEQIVPVEVKAEVNLKAKSLKTYREKLEPAVSVRTSMADVSNIDIGKFEASGQAMRIYISNLKVD